MGMIKNPMGLVITAAFWIAMLKFGNVSSSLVLAYLAVTFVVFAVNAIREPWTPFVGGFVAQVDNNDWVLRSVVCMALASMFFWWLDPTAPALDITLNPLMIAWNSIKETVMSTPEVNPFGGGGFWETVDGFFFGDNTAGWKDATFSLLKWALIAIPVSRWDDTKQHAGEAAVSLGAGSHPLAKQFLQHIKMEFLEVPLHVLWWIIKFPFKILLGRW